MPDGAAHLPFWPRGLSEDLAAAYVGVSASTFRAYVIPDVQEVWVTPGRKVWLREDLDRWLDGRKRPIDAPAGASDAPPAETPDASNPIAAGLANLPPPRRARRPHKAG